MFPGSKMYYNLPFRFFGCTVFVHIPTQFRLKLDHRAEKRVFVDYSPNQKGYKCYSPIKKKCFFFFFLVVGGVSTKMFHKQVERYHTLSYVFIQGLGQRMVVKMFKNKEHWLLIL